MAEPYDFLFKFLLVGDSGVGKSCLLTRFTADRFEETTTSTIGVDFRVKYLTVQDKKCKLTIWDTAGQERFRTLTSSYYRGAQAIIFVYDVTRRETFDNIEAIWLKEVDMYATVDDAIKMVVANKTDLAGRREVSAEEGHDLAKKHGCLFVQTSAKTNEAVDQAFDELLNKVLETPALLGGSQPSGVKLSAQAANQDSVCYC
uniref:Uncharacterized protein n=1 Tax=Dunaliella tertiolecta TaxID=3047 RepID=A0A7S3VUP7_DUNTE|mmetsp:Transcript_22717/g.62721  ORF Transcript_22717/g.62721 Transcript_22717/m.62721 type:complete len:202 (+) Transcript_22717:112-717(+)|eukprot:CAMPEP_0202360526 /NCGR_PEP_ID=MMETSP1126-20121109/13437_1 /ASSEMBLY_ACC=CAM_ASM_000457 /TAXON_ID=3047 /ORGANISM="Dunaliella tertiolecta, Strain CCMP1320" /LENGTH=201 /DNA_ID=CAMNT_0048954263 /DNA_START=81 /DNA_END=686 /DNA_ORIENTATION=+